ncbi:MAG: PilN domain-containing protein [Armatimonadetes bacterium]|nr:PilN domain-containing protein [Armatimonadota bacterium]
MSRIETEIAVVEWEPDRIRAYNPATSQSASAATAAEALRSVGSPTTVGLCLGRRVVLVRETHTPAAAKSDARLVVQLQMDRLFPAMQDDLAFDLMVGSHMHEDGLQTTVAAAKAETIRQALESVESAGVRVEWVAPAALGAQGVAARNSVADAVIAEAANRFLRLDVVRHGQLIYSRAVVDPGDADGRADEVARTLAASGLPDAAVLAVAGTEIGGTVRESDQGTLEAMASHTAADLHIELPEHAAKVARRRSRARSMAATVLWLVAVSAAALSWIVRNDAAAAAALIEDEQSKKARQAQVALDTAQSGLKSARTIRDSLGLAFAPAQPVYDVLTLVGNLVPEREAWLTGLTYGRGKDIQIRGVALPGDAVSQYTASLALSDRFTEVKLAYARNSDIEDTEVVQFSVTAHVVGNLPLVEKKTSRRRGR